MNKTPTTLEDALLRIKELEQAIEAAAIELEDGHCHPSQVGEVEDPSEAWDTVCVYNAHQILAKATWLKN